MLAEEELVGAAPVITKVVRAKVLVRVDGIKSQVRKVMVGDEPRDLCAITWNAVVPTVRYGNTSFFPCRRSRSSCFSGEFDHVITCVAAH